jgi:hypothetical protein
MHDTSKCYRPSRNGCLGGQLALIEPGKQADEIADFTDPTHNRVRWHIDGLNGLPSAGEVKNFDLLVGVLLSDVEAPMSGALGYFPGR